MPVLAIGGETSYADHVAEAMQLLADDVHGVTITGAGHWVAEEAPDQVLDALSAFLAAVRDAATRRRRTSLRRGGHPSTCRRSAARPSGSTASHSVPPTSTATSCS